MNQINYIPDPEMLDFASKLDQAISNLADSLSLEQIAALSETYAKEILVCRLQTFNAAESSIWVVDDTEKHLVPIFNSGPNRDAFVLKFKQPIHRGIISMVYATEMPFIEKEIQKNKRHDDRLDKELDYKTESMAVVPLYFAGSIRGVVTAINFSKRHPNPDFSESEFDTRVTQSLQIAARLIGRLLDRKLIDISLGL